MSGAERLDPRSWAESNVRWVADRAGTGARAVAEPVWAWAEPGLAEYVGPPGTKEMDRRTMSEHEAPHGINGSGPFGVLPPTPTDHATELFWWTVVTAAEILGHTNAARHLRHFLRGSGAHLVLDVESLLKGSHELQVRWARLTRELLSAAAQAHAAGIVGPDPVLEIPKQSFEFEKDTDGWYALGTCQVSASAVARCGPGGLLVVDVELHLADKYDWDEGKNIKRLGIEVRDEQLGRLHQVGLAQEFPASGSLLRTYSWIPGGAAPRIATP